MTQPDDIQRPPPANGDRKAATRWPLLGAIGLTLVAAVILIVQLTSILNERSATPLAAAADAAPVSLSSQPFSFLDRPVPVPDLKFVDGNERVVALSDFKGRPVLLNLFATWCLPCRKEMPALDRLQAKFDPSKFRVVTLSIDRAGLPAVKKFYADLGLKSLGIYVDQSGGALHQLGLIGLPGTLLINKEGLEIARKLGPAEWDGPEVAAILKERFGLAAAKTAGGAAP